MAALGHVSAATELTLIEARRAREEDAHVREGQQWDVASRKLQGQRDAARATAVAAKADARRLGEGLAHAQRLLRAARGQRGALTTQLEQWRSYAVALEAKVCVGSKGHTLATANKRLRQRVAELEDKVQGQPSRVEELERQLVTRGKEVAVLSRALDIHARELGLGRAQRQGAHGTPAQLLTAIAQARDETQGLAMELAERMQENEGLAAEKRGSQRKAEEQHAALQIARDAVQRLQEQLDAEAAKLRASLLAEQSLREKAASMDARLDLAMREAAVARHSVASLEAAASQRAEEVQNEHERLAMELEGARREARGAEGKRQSSATVAAVMEKQVVDLTAQRDRFKRALQERDDELARRGAQTQEVAALRRRLEETQSEAAQLTSREAAARRNEALAIEEIARATEDLRKGCEERDAALVALQKAVTYGATQSVAREELAESRQDVQKALEKSQESRAVLQRALLEQLGGLREELMEERRLRLEAEAARDAAFATVGSSSPPSATAEALRAAPSPSPASGGRPVPLPLTPAAAAMAASYPLSDAATTTAATSATSPVEVDLSASLEDLAGPAF